MRPGVATLEENISEKFARTQTSALGHKRTFATQKGMSALPPKAGMCSATRYDRFLPIADIGKGSLQRLG
ncbi:MAG: hypothetical protein WBX77_21205, partial [Pseudolabrys sp.]